MLSSSVAAAQKNGQPSVEIDVNSPFRYLNPRVASGSYAAGCARVQVSEQRAPLKPAEISSYEGSDLRSYVRTGGVLLK